MASVVRPNDFDRRSGILSISKTLRSMLSIVVSRYRSVNTDGHRVTPDIDDCAGPVLWFVLGQLLWLRAWSSAEESNGKATLCCACLSQIVPSRNFDDQALVVFGVAFEEARSTLPTHTQQLVVSLKAFFVQDISLAGDEAVSHIFQCACTGSNNLFDDVVVESFAVRPIMQDYCDGINFDHRLRCFEGGRPLHGAHKAPGGVWGLRMQGLSIQRAGVRPEPRSVSSPRRLAACTNDVSERSSGTTGLLHTPPTALIRPYWHLIKPTVCIVGQSFEAGLSAPFLIPGLHHLQRDFTRGIVGIDVSPHLVAFDVDAGAKAFSPGKAVRLRPICVVPDLLQVDDAGSIPEDLLADEDRSICNEIVPYRDSLVDYCTGDTGGAEDVTGGEDSLQNNLAGFSLPIMNVLFELCTRGACHIRLLERLPAVR
jgi:hypothetical protein